MIDWQRIRTEYEAGASQNSLAKKYGISQQAISKRVLKEGWNTSVLPQEIVVPPTTNQENLPLVDQALADLSNYLNGHPENAKLQLKEHKLFADSFSQYLKAKLLSPPEITTQQGVDWEMFNEEELAIIQPVFEKAFARKLQEKSAN